MQRADEPTAEPSSAVTGRSGLARSGEARSGQGRVSVALLAAVACMPIVIAIGFITDRTGEGAAGAAGSVAALPSDISVLALRGGLDSAADRRPPVPVRAGY